MIMLSMNILANNRLFWNLPYVYSAMHIQSMYEIIDTYGTYKTESNFESVQHNLAFETYLRVPIVYIEFIRMSYFSNVLEKENLIIVQATPINLWERVWCCARRPTSAASYKLRQEDPTFVAR